MTQVTCPKCQKNYKFQAENLGKKVKCADCDDVFIAEEIKSIENKTEKNSSSIKGDDISFKPHKWSFIFFGSPLFFFLFLLVISLLVGIFTPYALIVSGILAFLALITYFLVNIAYKKEKYTLTDRKIIHEYGNIISDNSVEINLDKITQVHSILGFIQNKIFKTGNLIVNTAGASSSRIVLKNILNTMEFYEEFQVRMKKNGFHLTKDKLVQEAKPHWLGVLGEVLAKLFGGFIGFIYLSAAITGMMEGLGIEGEIAFYILVVLFILIVIAYLTIIYLDLKRRKYDVYTDSVFYTEGFLTKHFAFLPMEKVANTENNQSFFSKIFGLHDVIVSSEGSNNKVVFKNMTEGEQMMKNIKYLKNDITMTKTQVLAGEEETVKESLVGFVDTTEEEVLDYDKEFTATYRMDFLKTFSASLFFLLIALLLFLIVGIEGSFVFIVLAASTGAGMVVKFFFTTFMIEKSSIESKFSFLTNKHNSFSVDKITGVKVKESLLDMLFKTCSITFWSIGSSSNITFANIKKTPELEKNILSKVGVHKEDDSKIMPVNFSLINFLKANIGTALVFLVIILVFLTFYITLPIYMQNIGRLNEEHFVEIMLLSGTLILTSILIVPVIKFLYQKIYYSKKFYSQKLAEHFISSKSGIFFRTTFFVLQKHIKGMTSTKYPLSVDGKLKINISGEQVVQDKNKKGFSIMSNSISISYLEKVFERHAFLDSMIQGEQIDETVHKSAKQDVGNSILGMVIFFSLMSVGAFLTEPIVGTLFIVVFGLIIGLVVWFIKVKYYNLEKQRAVAGGGIIYKYRQSILYKKFNFVSKNQGFLGKIFGNGTVNIYTLGSGSIDMKIVDCDNFNEIYETLKKD